MREHPHFLLDGLELEHFDEFVCFKNLEIGWCVGKKDNGDRCV